jgi:photosystem II stability/assembly factor-like uncharacterized protein
VRQLVDLDRRLPQVGARELPPRLAEQFPERRSFLGDPALERTAADAELSRNGLDVWSVVGEQALEFQAGMIKSTDAGVTWGIVAPGLFRRALGLFTLAIDPTDADRVFLSAVNGVYRTTDGGRTWIEVDHRLPVVYGTDVVALAIDPRTPSTVYAAGAFGVYRSTNGGLRWSPLNDGLPDLAFAADFEGPFNVLVLDPRQPGKLYAGTLATSIYTYTVQ